MADQCWCRDETKTETKTCVVCSTVVTRLMDEFWRKHKCPIHKPIGFRSIMICGECKFLCDECISVGWISTAGTGGGDSVYNIELNLELVRGALRAYDRERSSSEEEDEDIPF